MRTVTVVARRQTSEEASQLLVAQEPRWIEDPAFLAFTRAADERPCVHDPTSICVCGILPQCLLRVGKRALCELDKFAVAFHRRASYCPRLSSSTERWSWR
jgi:hypothetical protein